MWKFLDSTAVPLTLEAVSDISNIAEPNVNLMTHLEVPLVEALVGEGYPFSVAKKLAMRRFIENFGFKQESLPAESVGRAYDETGSLLALFMRNYTDSSFVENIEDFRLDLADGVYEDSLALVEFADYVVKNWQNMRMPCVHLAIGSCNLREARWLLSVRQWFYGHIPFQCQELESIAHVGCADHYNGVSQKVPNGHQSAC